MKRWYVSAKAAILAAAVTLGDPGPMAAQSAPRASEHGGVMVVIDPASAAHLGGASLDFNDGLQGAGFSIQNPNATRSCGCGQSFS